MSAATEMSRLDSLPTETLNKLLEMSGQTIIPTAVSNPEDGDVLVYDGTANVWKNGTGGGSGGGALVEEFTWSERGITPVAISTDDAKDILDAYKSGKTVIMHFPYLRNYGVAGWFTLGGISPYVDEDGEEIPDSIANMNYSGYYLGGNSEEYIPTINPLSNAVEVSIDENGKLNVLLTTD